MPFPELHQVSRPALRRIYVDADTTALDRPEAPATARLCRAVPATLAHKVPNGDGWLLELKHDDFRIFAFKDGERVRLWPRNGRDWSYEFVAITAAMRRPT